MRSIDCCLNRWLWVGLLVALQSSLYACGSNSTQSSGAGGAMSAGGVAAGSGGAKSGAGGAMSGSGGAMSGSGGAVMGMGGMMMGMGGTMSGAGGMTMGMGGMMMDMGGMMSGAGGMTMGMGGTKSGAGGMMMGMGGTTSGAGGMTMGMGGMMTGGMMTDGPSGSACHAAGTLQVTANGMTAYVIDGVDNPTLTFCRGDTYVFAVNASGHPFYIKTVQGTGTGNAYTSGVTGNGVTSGNLTFIVPADAPATLYYDCSLHTAMTGIIHVVN
jgi:hypothetical protein